jgi:AcrR family transcriptional regulator
MTSKKGRPSKNADDAREALIMAAKQKFVSKPYDRVSIRELAQLAGVNSAMIKYYFQSKEGLYKAMILDVTGQVFTGIQTKLNGGKLESLEEYFSCFSEVIKQSPEFPLLMLKEVILNQGVCREYFLANIGQVHMQVFDQIYNHFKAIGKLKDDIDPLFFRMSLMGLTLYPWYLREIMGRFEGVIYDDDFVQRLVTHNSNLMQYGCFKGETDDK